LIRKPNGESTGQPKTNRDRHTAREQHGKGEK
jgi:hypothetical protein